MMIEISILADVVNQCKILLIERHNPHEKSYSFHFSYFIHRIFLMVTRLHDAKEAHRIEPHFACSYYSGSIENCLRRFESKYSIQQEGNEILHHEPRWIGCKSDHKFGRISH